MSEFNLEKFSYQRKRSAVSKDGSIQKSAVRASTSTSTNYLDSDPALNYKNVETINIERDKQAALLANGDWSAERLAELVEIFPSETRLKLVDAITSSSSMEEAVNSVCDSLSPNKYADRGKSHGDKARKRKRHCFISDDEDDDEATCISKRTCDDKCIYIKDDGEDDEAICTSSSKMLPDDGCEEINDSDYNAESPRSSRRSQHAVLDVSSTDNGKQEDEVISVSDDEVGENNFVVNVVDCTGDADDSEDETYNNEEMVTILSFFNDCSAQELGSVPGLSVKKAVKIIKMRPFDSWNDLVSKLDSAPNLSSQLIDNCQSLLDERKVVEDLMNECENISSKIQDMLTSRISAINDGSSLNGKRGAAITSQPKSLNNSLQLKPYQLTSLNWLALMHEQKVNAILADEMGLGKTVQAIAFLAHLIESGENGPHLIIVPASTLDNWCREIKTWCPSVDFMTYYGNQGERTLLRAEAECKQLKPEIVITTYSIANGNDEDRRFLRKLNCNYLVLDEGHMLKNMQSQRYQGLMRLRVRRRLLLTGTPLQNNLLELMSLLSFVMPSMFGESFEGIKMLFSYSKTHGEAGSNYEKTTVAQAKRIMKPFVLRRLKKDVDENLKCDQSNESSSAVLAKVLQQLPAKHDHVIKCELTEGQRQLYNDSFVNCSNQFKQVVGSSQYNNILMMLRKAANHPLLLRNLYNDGTLLEMAKKYCEDPAHRDSEPDLVFEDMTVMSDFELHGLCREERRLADHCLSKDVLIKSGKFVYLDSLLPELKEKSCRVLLFSQFTMVMDIIQVYLSDRRHRYLRLDGQTSVMERQGLIDKFNGDPNIFVFLLSTKAGGVGINLTSANVVILHDIDFNPYNDKQAEDRCHRVGQTRDVTVYRLIAKDTIEEAILQCAQNKLRLEQDMATNDDADSPKDVSKLLQEAFNN